MLTLDSLRAYGANVDEGMNRCINNEAFYLRMVTMGLNDPNFDNLARAMAAGSVTDVFSCVHALKGSIGNVALTPIYEPICEMTELLRGQTEMVDVSEPYARVVAAYEEARKLLA